MTEIPTETLVTVFGGSGFLGRHVVRALAREGYRIRPAVRRPDLAGHLQPLGRVGQIHAVQANLRYPASVEAAVRGRRRGHQPGRHPVRARQAALRGGAGGRRAPCGAGGGRSRRADDPCVGARRRPGFDRRSMRAARRRAKRRVLAAVPDATIFRPSIVFGPEDDFFNRFAALARMSPALPLIGGGQTKFQPVFVGDVARGDRRRRSAAAAKGGTIYELGGPEVKTFRELMEYVLAVTERRRLLVPLPFGLARLQGDCSCSSCRSRC